MRSVVSAHVAQMLVDGSLGAETDPAIAHPLAYGLVGMVDAAAHDRVDMADLAGYEIVVWGPEHEYEYTDILVGMCRRAGFEPRIILSHSRVVARFAGVAVLAKNTWAAPARASTSYSRWFWTRIVRSASRTPCSRSSTRWTWSPAAVHSVTCGSW